MRLVAQRCLYGVDVNPLAVEMAKLSLWLLTLAKDRPFEFLDHAIRCGDSLVGLHDLEQLRHYSLEPVADDAVLFKGPLDEAVDEAIALRLRLGDMPANTVEDIEAQEALLREAEDRIARLRCAADLLVAAEFWGENARDKQERVRHAAVASGHYVEHGPTGEFEEQAAKERRGQKMFHWPLEFPEVIVKRGGFDAFVGNPPFMGGQRITGLFSVYYRNLLVTHLAFGKRGSADLCAFFFLRAASLLSIDTGHLGFLSTNTIAQGDTRQVCLDQLIDNGYSITRALPTTQWPGIASIEIAELWLYRGKWIAPALLDGTPVESITPYLTAQEVVCGSPFRLVRNANTAFIGSQVQGAGFVLNPEKAQLLIRSSNNNRRVLFPYLRGQDFNTEPDLSPQSWVINFFDWPLDESGGRPCASDFPECLEIVERLVKPQRESMKGRNAIADKRAKYWWHYGSPAPTLYRRIEELELSRVLFHSFTSKYVAFGFAPVGIVYAAPHVVFTRSDDHDFAILQSSLHESWVIQYCSTMRTDIRYAPSDVFETFPFPSDSNESYAEVKSMGCEYYAVRQAIMCNTGLGLTKTYNRFHAPDETAADIQKLRELHVEMDQAVAAAYGWGDLDLGHGFHETKQGLRYTISEAARREVLQRLLRLNHERYAEEVRQGLHDKKKGQGKRAGAAKKRKIPSSAAPKLFGDADETR